MLLPVKAKLNKKLLFFSILFGALFVVPFFCVFAGIQDEINARNKQIEQIQKEIEVYQQQIDANSGKANTLATEIANLNSRIGKLQLEIKSLGLTIEQTNAEIGNTQLQINIAKQQLEVQRNALANYIRILSDYDRENLATILFKNSRLSNYFDSLKNLYDTQNKATASIVSIKELKADLEANELVLEDKKIELEGLKSLQESQKNNLNADKSQKNKILTATKGEEARYQKLVKDSKAAIQAIRDQITYLLQVGISVEDAVKYAQLAAIRAGIRPAYLLAELNQESGFSIDGGSVNVGRCYIKDTVSGASVRFATGEVYKNGIHPTRDLPYFLLITSELGKESISTPISCWPGHGWGGAMGPAQFIPSTWMGYKEEVARLTGHNPPDPWSVEDAFTAAAAKLSRDGANSKTSAGEMAASKKYYCGNSQSRNSKCVNYANAVQSKAAAIEPNL